MTDTELLNHFFWAWGMADTDQRRAVIADCFAADATYADPHCEAPVTGVEAVVQMLAAFATDMPGSSARVSGQAEGHNGFMRADVVFERNGSEMMRGRYFARREGDRLTLVVGFAGAAA